MGTPAEAYYRGIEDGLDKFVFVVLEGQFESRQAAVDEARKLLPPKKDYVLVAVVLYGHPDVAWVGEERFNKIFLVAKKVASGGINQSPFQPTPA